MTTSITELSITESLKRYGVKMVTKEGNKLTIRLEENQQFTFQTYGSNIRKTIDSFEESANSIPTLSRDAKDALKIYLANQTMKAVEAAPDTEEEAKKEVYMQKYSNGRLAEAVILAGKPCFLIADREGNIRTTEQLELEDKIVKPLEFGMYMNKPYAFSSIEELNAYVDATRKETIDSLYSRIRTLWRKYVDGDEAHIVISAADTLYTYYQDRVGLTHYLFFVGNNGSGKSNNLRVFQQLAYRNMTSTDITSANIYRFLGSDEEGQGTICEDEADGIDENAEKMRIYKEGYTATGSKVMRSDSTNYGIKQQAFYTYCWKAFAAERLPDSVKAKGFNQRCIEIQCFPGLPKYDIVEVVNPAGVEEYQELLDELTETRNTLLIYRLCYTGMNRSQRYS
jgi:hypothetical protein